MIKSAFIITVSVISVTASGQQLRQQTNHYRSPEVLLKQRVETDIDKLLGEGKAWNLEGAEVSKRDSKIRKSCMPAASFSVKNNKTFA